MKSKMFLILAFIPLGLLAQSIAVVYSPVGSTRMLQRTDLIIVAPNIMAEPDNAKGQAAFDTCAAANPNSTFVCANSRAVAITEDAQARFIDAFRMFYNRAPETPDQILTGHKLYFVQPQP